MYGRRNPVREIGSTRSPARKTPRPQLTRATARRWRANPTKKRTNGQVAATACIGGGGSSRSNGANRRSHTDALPLDLDTVTDLLPTHRPEIRCLSRFRSPRRSAGSVNCARRRRRWDIKMETMEQQVQEQKARVMVPAVCAVNGCTAKRKYRLVRDWERGACGMDHLHILERQSGSGPVAV